MEIHPKKHVYPQAEKAFENFRGAVDIFQAVLGESGEESPPNFYKGRNLLREGEEQLQLALQNARKLLGPLPEYVTDDYRRWREDFVRSSRILAEGSDLEDLRVSLSKDEFVARWIPKEDLDRLLERNFPRQEEGKRRMANIKIRIILDCLFELLESAKQLQKQALSRLRS